MDIPLFIQVPADDRQFSGQASGHLPKHQALPRVVQHRTSVFPCFFPNPMGQPPKGKHVDIHNPAVRMHAYQIHLRLHGKLIRHDHEEIPFRFSNRALYDFPVERRTFSCTGCTGIKTQ